MFLRSFIFQLLFKNVFFLICSLSHKKVILEFFNTDRTLYRPLMYACDASPGVIKYGLLKIFEFSKLSDLGKIQGPDRQALSRSKNVLASQTRPV